jgi:folate-dependent tRNA-U54 methylase TrmFO/GidA
MISKTFHRMNIGKVKHVELIGTTGKGNRAHVFFSEMYDTEESRVVQENVNANKSSKLSYAKNEHVFWIMLNSRRVYDGSSNAGEYVEQVAVEFTEEELDFMDAHNPIVDTSLVDVAYVESIENELYHSRNALAELQMNNQLLFNEYNRLLASSVRTMDTMDMWVHLADNNQMECLKREMCSEGKKPYPVVTVECVDMDIEFEGYEYDETNANTSEMTLDEIAV